MRLTPVLQFGLERARLPVASEAWATNLLKSLDQVHQCAEGDAGGAFGEPRLGIVVPGGAGDVEVNPWRVAGEFADEPRAGDGTAAFAAADVLDVGKTSLD